MKSKEPEYRAAYWQKWTAKNRPRRARSCLLCAEDFYPHGPQKRCDKCRTLTCGTCRKAFISPNARMDQGFCSRRCAALQPHVLERLKAKRGNKPRTAHLHPKRPRGNVFERKWRQMILERDNHTCRKCGQRGGRLEADHIKPFSRFPRLRYLLSNGRTLCVKCHKKTATYGSKARTYDKRRKTEKAKRLSQEVLNFEATP